MPERRPIQLMRPGRHTAMRGDQVEFAEADLTASAAAYDPSVSEAPLVVGHPHHDAPAYGWVSRLVFAEGVLAAEPHQVDPAFAEMVRTGRFKKISASFYRPGAGNNPVPDVYYLRHVGFLGAQPPAVKGLRDASFQDEEADVITLEFAEEIPAWSIARVFRALREWLIEKDGTEVADRVVPGYLVEEAEESARSPGDSAAPAFSEGDNPTPSEEADMPESSDKARERELDAREEAIKVQEGELAQQTAAARRTGLVEFVEGLVKQGRVLPRDQAGLVELMASLDADAALEFGEGDDAYKGGAVAWLQQFLAALPEQVDFSERSGDTDERSRSTVEFATAPGYQVNPERLELHSRALAYQREHEGADYITAVQAVQ